MSYTDTTAATVMFFFDVYTFSTFVCTPNMMHYL